MSGPVIGPAACPAYSVPFLDDDGRTMNTAWWRYLRQLGVTVANAATVTELVDIQPGIGGYRPDLMNGARFFRVLLNGNAALAAPVNAPDGIAQWTLIVDNPTGQPWTLSTSPAYFLNFQITVLPQTRTTIQWLLSNGENSVADSAFNNPIPPPV